MLGWLFNRRSGQPAVPSVDTAFNGPWPISELDLAAGEFLIHEVNGNLVKFLLAWPKLKRAETVADVGFDWVAGEFKRRRVTFKTIGMDDAYLVFEPDTDAPSVISDLHAALLRTGKFRRI